MSDDFSSTTHTERDSDSTPSIGPDHAEAPPSRRGANFYVGLVLWLGVCVSLLFMLRNRDDGTSDTKNGAGNGRSTALMQPNLEPIRESDLPDAETTPGQSDSTSDAVDDQEAVDAQVKLEVSWSDKGLTDFSFTDRSGDAVSKNDLLGKPWVASFIFTTCAGPCARVSAAMQQLHQRYEDRDVRFVTFTVNPKTDTPEVLAHYADFYEADPDRWFFLTGDRDKLYNLIQRDFLMPVGESPDPEPGWEIIHTTKICLVDATGRVVGAYVSVKDEELLKLRRDLDRMLDASAIGTEDAEDDDPSAATSSKQSSLKPIDESRLQPAALKLPAWMQWLPTVNASLNGLSTILLIAGLLLIRKGHRDTHRNVMLTAFGVSVLFLLCYGVYHIGLHHYTGTHGKSFTGSGTARAVYLTILISHVILAAVVPVLAILTIVRGLKANWEKHRRIAKITFPVWLYVSITGVVIYLMLYHWPIDEPAV